MESVKQNLKRILLIIMAFLPANLVANKINSSSGEIDLRTWDFQTSPQVHLDGKWEFYWGKLLEPADLTTYQKPPESYHVPRFWGGQSIDGVDRQAKGFATYRLKVLLPKEHVPLTLKVGEQFTAYTLWINGVSFSNGGNPGISRATTTPSRRSLLIPILPTQEIEIVLQMANYETRKGGTWKNITLGHTAEITKDHSLKLGYHAFIFGSLIFMGIYHFFLFLLRRDRLAPLFFGLFCLSFAVRNAEQCEFKIISLMFSHVDFWMSWRLEMLGSFLSAACLFTYVGTIFPVESKMWSRKLVGIVYGCLSFAALLLPFRMYIHLLPVFQISTLLFAVLFNYYVILAILRKREGSWILVAGFISLSIGAVNDILASAEIINSSDDTFAFALYICCFFQSIVISMKFSRAFSQVEESQREISSLNNELKEHIEHLDELVAEKTRDIRSILSNIKQGIFMIKTDGRVAEEYSLYLESILERKEVVNSTLSELILNQSTLSSDEQSQLESLIEASLDGSEICFSINEANFPNTISIQDSASQKIKILEADWSPIAKNETVDKILVTIRDVTKVRELQLATAKQQEELEIIRELVNVTPEHFTGFLKACDQMLGENIRLIQANEKVEPDVVKILFINMHTLKGIARTFHFSRLTPLIHDIEQLFALMQKGKVNDWNVEAMVAEIDNIGRIVNLYEATNKKLGRIDDKKVIQMMKERVRETMEELQHLPLNLLNEKERSIITKTLSLFTSALYSDLKKVLNENLVAAERLARDLGKENPVIDLVVEGHDFAVSESGCDLIKNIFTHLVRNSLDHGLESATERKNHGKDSRGIITLKVNQSGDYLNICYRDDGRGLNFKRLKKIGLDRGLINECASPVRVAELIFSSGLSTNTTVNQISGRGVGMEAVREYLENVGGSIDLIIGEIHDGFVPVSFQIKIPKSLYIVQ